MAGCKKHPETSKNMRVLGGAATSCLCSHFPVACSLLIWTVTGQRVVWGTQREVRRWTLLDLAICKRKRNQAGVIRCWEKKKEKAAGGPSWFCHFLGGPGQVTVPLWASWGYTGEGYNPNACPALWTTLEVFTCQS